jgi:5-methyltetrahydropteroyltriglutamate--homocysteine methyltransferase
MQVWEKTFMANGQAIRTDNVGSILRPPELLQARQEFLEGRLSREALTAAEDQAILDVLELQRSIGMDVVTDGEYRRDSWLTGIQDAVEGFVSQNRLAEWKGPGGGLKQVSGQVVGGPLKQKGRLYAHEAAFLAAHAPTLWKITTPSATQFAGTSYMDGVTTPYYATRADLLNELTRIVGDELRALVVDGVRYIQIDAPSYVGYADPSQRERRLAAGEDLEASLARDIAADNATFAGIPRDDVVVAAHLCRGNSRSRWISEGGYDPIAERLFSELDANRFLLEYDSDRAGGFEPLRFLPAGKTAVLGLVTTKEGTLESKDELLRRIDQASQYAPVERLAVSPQCGFATVSAGNLLSHDDQRRKLELLVAVAQTVWK